MKTLKLVIIFSVLIVFSACKHNNKPEELNIRQIVDTIGFAQYDWQMDSIMNRLEISVESDIKWRVVISPHDDYAYVGNLYPEALNGIKAKTVILFGVAHKARNYDLENKIIFDSYDEWSAPYGSVKVSDIRNDLISNLPDSLIIVHDEMQSVEHSLEAIIPFLQYNNRELEIIPILVPYMSFEKMQQISISLSKSLSSVMDDRNLSWGDDIAMVITTDAVHYGDEDWGGKNYAPYGTDSVGLKNARNHEMDIINNCLIDDLSIDKVQSFVNYTVQESDYKEYKWTWCGRYSVPLGLLTAYELNKLRNGTGLSGSFIAYANSIDHPVLKVDDLKMGTTAPANNRHWVGYPAVGYK
ncbi:MAG: AmmeMemoRadiSam system protein B [Bacteroidales bacterium]|nr:AmmeMemoRadiSam system protein B [Bacteroidales bacterium]